MAINVKLSGVGTYLPGNPIDFDEINHYLGEFQEAPKKIKNWAGRVQPIIKEMLGINHCYYAFDNETRTFTDDNLTMSVKAAKKAMEDAGVLAKDIDLLIYGGAFSHQIPPITTRIQEELGIDLCGEIHIHSNCTSVYKAIKLAHIMLASGEYKNALVISSSVASSCFIPEFYNQSLITKEDIFLRWYLCDGAGAMLFSAVKDEKEGLYLEDTYFESTGSKKRSAMGNSYPYHWTNPKEDYQNGYHHIRQIYLNEMRDYAMEENGKSIFHNALIRMINEKDIDLKDLKHFVVNMPSKFVRELIIEECLGLGIRKDQFYSAIEDVGYAGPPAALISIDNLLKEHTYQSGDLIFSFVMEVSKFMQAGFTLRKI